MGTRGKVGVLLLSSSNSSIVAVTRVDKGVVGQYKKPGSDAVYQLLKGFRGTAATGPPREKRCLPVRRQTPPGVCPGVNITCRFTVPT